MIVFACPACQKKLQAADEHVGKAIACPECKATMTVPPQADAPATAITTAPAEPTSIPATAVTTPEHARKPKPDARDEDDDDERRPRRRDRRDDEAPKSGIGIGMILLILGVLGGGVACVIAILIALLVPAVAKVREAAARTQTLNNLKQIGLAAHNHHDMSKHFPSPQNQPPIPGMKAPDLSWRVTILPFIEQQNMWQQFDKTADWNHANNNRFLAMMPQPYICITAGQQPQGVEKDTFLQYFTGPNTLFPDPLKIVKMQDITDGTSNTLLVAQANKAAPWSKAEDMVVPGAGPLPLPNTPFPVLLADGSVRWIMRNRVTDATLCLFIDPRDGQAVPPGALD